MPNGTIPSWIPTNPAVGATYTSPDGTLAVSWDGFKFVAVPPIFFPASPQYAVSTLPPNSSVQTAATVWVTDESGGPCLAVNDGVNWRRIYDNAIVA